uniref:Uncharacterized protein n=1 Tax=Mycobacterium riyadhense TaxID=486698 RepID=A0A653F494_9MYCO|nr:hypothetical protein BIN_B_05350 [Mycobacterium riyadhense]
MTPAHAVVRARYDAGLEAENPCAEAIVANSSELLGDRYRLGNFSGCPEVAGVARCRISLRCPR